MEHKLTQEQVRALNENERNYLHAATVRESAYPMDMVEVLHALACARIDLGRCQAQLAGGRPAPLAAAAPTADDLAMGMGEIKRPALRQGAKAIQWSYPTSPNAMQFGFGTTGCWAVTDSYMHPTRPALAGFETPEEAVAYAKDLEICWAPGFLEHMPAQVRAAMTAAGVINAHGVTHWTKNSGPAESKPASEAPAKIAVEFDTRAFRDSHGAEPRGRGGWAFALSLNPKNEDVWFAPGALTYTEAKRAAAAHYRAELARTSTAPLTGAALLVIYAQP